MAQKSMIATEYKVVYETHTLAIDDCTLAKVLDDYGIYWYGQDEDGEFLSEWTISASGLKDLLNQIESNNEHKSYKNPNEYDDLWFENISLKNIEDTIKTILKYGYIDDNDNIHIRW